MRVASFQFTSTTGGTFRPAVDVIDPFFGTGKSIAALIEEDPARYLVEFAGMTAEEASAAKRQNLEREEER